MQKITILINVIFVYQSFLFRSPTEIKVVATLRIFIVGLLLLSPVFLRILPQIIKIKIIHEITGKKIPFDHYSVPIENTKIHIGGGSLIYFQDYGNSHLL